VCQGSSRGSWKAKAQRESMPWTGVPSMSTEPALGASSPAAARSSVDLPQPLGPRMARTSPRRTSKLMSRSTVWAAFPVPKVRRSARKETGKAEAWWAGSTLLEGAAGRADGITAVMRSLHRSWQ
jgi:hypothetical protein